MCIRKMVTTLRYKSDWIYLIYKMCFQLIHIYILDCDETVKTYPYSKCSSPMLILDLFHTDSLSIAIYLESTLFGNHISSHFNLILKWFNLIIKINVSFGLTIVFTTDSQQRCIMLCPPGMLSYLSQPTSSSTVIWCYHDRCRKWTRLTTKLVKNAEVVESFIFLVNLKASNRGCGRNIILTV